MKANETPKAEPLQYFKETEDGKILIEFQEGDIKQLIKLFAEVLHKNFTYDDALKGTVSLIGPKEVSKWEAKKIFEAALEAMGYTVIYGWPINKVVPLSQAKTEGNLPVLY